jgi:hypothetical protein
VAQTQFQHEQDSYKQWLKNQKNPQPQPVTPQPTLMPTADPAWLAKRVRQEREFYKRKQQKATRAAAQKQKQRQEQAARQLAKQQKQHQTTLLGSAFQMMKESAGISAVVILVLAIMQVGIWTVKKRREMSTFEDAPTEMPTVGEVEALLTTDEEATLAAFYERTYTRSADETTVCAAAAEHGEEASDISGGVQSARPSVSKSRATPMLAMASFIEPVNDAGDEECC